MRLLDKNGRLIKVGDTINVSNLFVVRKESNHKYRLISDYDISPNSPFWQEYEPADNIEGRKPEELEIQ